MTRRLCTLLFLPVLAFALAACSAGSSSSGGGGGSPPAFALNFDTAAGGSDVITARVEALVFEAIDGSLTTNLLPAPVDLTLVDPSGESAGLALRRPTQIGSVAVHLLVSSALALRADGSRESITLPSNDLRIAIDGTFDPAGTAPLTVIHGSSPRLTPRAGGGLEWAPSLTASLTTDLILRASDAVVMSVDRARGSLILTLPGYQDLSFDLSVPATSRLVGEDGRGRSRDDFLAECRSGSSLSFDGIGRSSRELESRSAHHHGATRGELKLLGRITSIDSVARSFAMDVQAAIRRGVRIQVGFASVTIDARNAVIYASHRSIQTSASFGDLLVGALVEVEGNNPVGDTMTAREIELEDDHGQHQPGETEGQVVAIDVNAGTITVGPRGNDPLLVGGSSVPSATIEVSAATAIYRRTSSGLVSVTLDGLSASDRIWVRGSITAPQVVRADWVRVDAR